MCQCYICKDINQVPIFGIISSTCRRFWKIANPNNLEYPRSTTKILAICKMTNVIIQISSICNILSAFCLGQFYSLVNDLLWAVPGCHPCSPFGCWGCFRKWLQISLIFQKLSWQKCNCQNPPSGKAICLADLFLAKLFLKHSVCPPIFALTIVFKFYWEDCIFPRPERNKKVGGGGVGGVWLGFVMFCTY